MRMPGLFTVVALALMLGACATREPVDVTTGEAQRTVDPMSLPDALPKLEPIREAGPNKPYDVMGQRYEPPRLQVFTGVTQTACGGASSASGPFYCPADRKVYLDTAFFQQLAQRFGAPGDFAAAYVIAHEVGHHIQNLLGTMDKMEQAGLQRGGRDRNALSVRLELQADCYAGVWGFYAAKRNLLETGDVEEGLRAASAVGDDNITKGRVSPDAFTHGTAAQRAHWFRQGLSTGDPRTCNTFAAGTP